MTTFEKFFFWAGIVESVFIVAFIIGASLITREEKIRRKQEDYYRGKKIEDPWPEWKDKK